MDAERPETEQDARLHVALDRLIPRYVQLLRGAIADAEGPDRLTMPQMRCLQAIAVASGSATTTQLAELTSVTVPTMSSMIDGLVTRGLVERRPDPDNRRRVHLIATGQAHSLLERYQAIMDDRHRAIIAGLSGQEREQLLDATERLLAEVERMLANAIETKPADE